MRIVDVIEECSLCNTPDEVIWQIAKTYTNQEISRLIQLFLRGIGNQHRVPGQVIYTLQGIINDYNDFGNMTNEQKIYAIGRIVANWNQMSCESRAELNL